jgi:hypothetical protein
VEYQSPSTYQSKDIANMAEHQGQLHYLYPWIGLVTRNTHVKYQSPSTCTYHSKVIAKVKVFDRIYDRQDKTKMPLDIRSWGHNKRKD